MNEFWHTVAGIVVGGLISTGISYYFAQKASKELRQEADALRRETEDVRHYINALISYLEAAGEISVVRDEEGRPIETTIIHASAAALTVSGMSARATVEEGDPPEGEERVPEEGNEA